MNAVANLSERPRFWTMAAEEPFRIFFPVGLLIGLSGVSLWPLFFLGVHKSFYPGVMHARMMIEGFLGAFVFGFLGTAAPRLTGAKPFRKRELAVVLVPFVAAIGTHVAERYVGGDTLFLATLLIFVGLLAKRFRERDDLPPPGFVLVGFGFLNAIIGTTLLVYGGLHPEAIRVNYFGTLLLYQGFIMYLVLGIGGFLLPRFLGMPRPTFPESRSPSRVWLRKAALALGCGVLLLGSFAIELLPDLSRAAYIVRCVTAAAYLLGQLPFHRAVGRVTLMRALQLSLYLLLAGLAFPVLLPSQRIAGLHVLFLGGFTLVTLAVATRVVLGHSGNQHRFTSSLRPLAAAALLVVIALALRTVGDFLPLQRSQLLSWASYLWMLGAGIWAIRILPLVRKPDVDAS